MFYGKIMTKSELYSVVEFISISFFSLNAFLEYYLFIPPHTEVVLWHVKKLMIRMFTFIAFLLMFDWQRKSGTTSLPDDGADHCMRKHLVSLVHAASEMCSEQSTHWVKHTARSKQSAQQIKHAASKVRSKQSAQRAKRAASKAHSKQSAQRAKPAASEAS